MMNNDQPAVDKVLCKATGRVFAGPFESFKVEMTVLQGEFEGKKAYYYGSIEDDEKLARTRATVERLGLSGEWSPTDSGAFEGVEFDDRQVYAVVIDKGAYLRVTNITSENHYGKAGGKRPGNTINANALKRFNSTKG